MTQNDRIWDDMLAEFRALGGIADNICLKRGPFGRGLFPCDPSKPVKVHIPESLLVDVTHFKLENGKVRVGEAAGISARARQFLEFYQQNFAWGASRQETGTLMQMLHEAPLELQQVLHKPFQLSHWLAGSSEDALFQRFLDTRVFGRDGGQAVIPIVELANYGPGVGYDAHEGVGLSGQFSGEILVRYAQCDPLDLFASWGFANRAPFALSLPLRMDGPAGAIVIERNKVALKSERAPFFPEVSDNDGELTLTHMMLGHKKFPRLARGIFYKIMRGAGRPNPELAFDEIQHVNRMQFLRLMELSESAAAPLAQLLRTVARFQLEAMSHHIGTRDVDAEISPSG